LHDAWRRLDDRTLMGSVETLEIYYMDQ
jgi:hypothetical protein